MSENELSRIRKENAELRARIARLENELAALQTHATLAQGMRGETLVTQIVEGEATAYAAGHDIEVVGANGVRIEVKLAKLNRPVKTAPTLRWAWGKIYGESGNKEYDWLVLVGKADERYQEQYVDPTSPFVFFAIPKSEIEPITAVQGRHRGIYLTTNPTRARKSRAYVLYERYAVTAKQLHQRFGL